MCESTAVHIMTSFSIMQPLQSATSSTTNICGCVTQSQRTHHAGQLHSTFPVSDVARFTSVSAELYDIDTATQTARPVVRRNPGREVNHTRQLYSILLVSFRSSSLMQRPRKTTVLTNKTRQYTHSTTGLPTTHNTDNEKTKQFLRARWTDIFQ